MDIESLTPFLLILSPFLVAFFLEALVVYFFRLKGFWASLGLTVVVNLLSLALVYFVASALLAKLGYDVGSFNGLSLSLPVVAFLWWFSSVAEGLFMHLFFRGAQKPRVWLASMVMNLVSYLFLYVFIVNSH